jgi:hypothetical protein
MLQLGEGKGNRMRAHCRVVACLALVSFALALGFFPLPANAADSLEGTWQHQRDSGGWKPLPGADITLRLDKGGHAVLTATAPNQNPLEVPGTWSVQGGRVTINIPEQFEISNQPYQLQGVTLTLPSQLSDDKPGTSTWVRVKSEGLALIFAAFNHAVEEGKSGAAAAEEAAEEARKQKGVEKVEVTPGGEGLALTVEGPAKVGAKPKVYVLFAGKWAPLEAPTQRKPVVSPMAADPRTHLDALNPPGDPDAPKARTALVVAPFHSKSYYAFRPEVWKEGDTKPRPLTSVAKEVTFKALGDNPEGVAKILSDAGYNVKTLIDDQATPGAVFRALQGHPSVIYFATHGGVAEDNSSNAIAVGGFIGVTAADAKTAPPLGNLTGPEAFRRLNDLLTQDHLPPDAAKGVTVGCLEAINGVQFCFPYLWPAFFEAALGKQGVPDSFVFLDACHTASSQALARTFKPKVFLGYDPTVAGWATARFAQVLFKNLAHRGHSVGEAWDRLRDLAEGAGILKPEEAELATVTKGGVNLAEEGAKLKAWGIDRKPYDRINTQVFWLMWLARWANKDVNNGAEALGRCYNLFWKPPGKRPGPGEPFCSQGTLGAHTPLAGEVEEARFLVSGKPTKPIGRFVLR